MRLKNRLITFSPWLIIAVLLIAFPLSAQIKFPQVVTTPIATATPTPILTAPTPLANSAAAIALREHLTKLLDKEEFAPASIGLKIISQKSGQVVFERDAQKLLMPASNMKIYTTATALENLGPDYRIKTSVYLKEAIKETGHVGELILYGRGDPTLDSSYFTSRHAFEDLAKQLVQAGIKQVDGDIIADESYFKCNRLGDGWEWLDAQWAFGAEVSALSVNENLVEVSLLPAEKAGQPCRINIRPDVGYVQLINKMETKPARTDRSIGIHRGLDNNSLLVWGQLPLDDKGFTTRVAVHKPGQLAGELFKAALQRAGIVVTGTVQLIDASLRSPALPSEPEAHNFKEIAFVESPPLSELVKVVNKFSQNLYAEQLLRILGHTKTKPNQDNDEAGIEIVKSQLRQANIVPERLSICDGSGLSRRDLVSAQATAQLLRYMSNRPSYNAFQASLPIAGVDGTLGRRMQNSIAKQNVQAKTGTLTHTSSLSGYANSLAGEQFVFSIIINHYTGEFQNALLLENSICEALAGLSTKLE